MWAYVFPAAVRGPWPRVWINFVCPLFFSDSSLWGKKPESFQYKDNKAVIDARHNEAQQIIDHFKQWLPRANQVCENKLKQDQEAEERRQQEELQKRIQREKERADVLQRLKF